MELICIENRRAPFVLAFESSAKEFGYEPKILTPAREPPASFQKFTAVYKHLSVNTENFERSIHNSGQRLNYNSEKKSNTDRTIGFRRLTDRQHRGKE